MNNKLDNHVRAYEGDLLYDFDNEIILKWYAKRIVETTKNCKSLLELGLGYGYTTSIFSKNIKDHLVIEGSQAVIDNFKKNFPDCSADVIKNLFEDFKSDRKYEMIVMGFVLEHVDDPVRVLKHYKNFLSDGGSVFVSVPNAEVLNRRLGHEMGLLPDMTVMSEHDHILGHQRYYTVETLKNDAEEAGYEVTRLEGIYLKPLTTRQMLTLNLDHSVIDALCKVGVDYPELCCAMLAELKIPQTKKRS
jgi:2-polyprenyl-3-methyl-5-hydroxy-6-metoxy-1,4-benzoquinol methylase